MRWMTYMNGSRVKYCYLMFFGCWAFVGVLAAQQLETGKSIGFKNPILPGFHPDPSVCRVGDDFYLVNSSFQYFPGVPVYHSKDLVHWKQIGACLTRTSQVDLTGADGNNGIYAPTIRYYNGRFYMITTLFPSRKTFYVHTDNPKGEWSDPVVLDFVRESCDATLFFDKGKSYFLWVDDYVRICEIDLQTGKQLSEIKRLWSGMGGRYPEGPHLYKKDGYYYLLLAEGGTEHGHHVTIARSRFLDGPYIPCPANPILSHFNQAMQNSSIQGLGHADLVQASDGSWWMVCLGYRTHGYLQHVMGRETFLAPVSWEQGAWPVVNKNGTLSLDMNVPTLPLQPWRFEPETDEFIASKLSWDWSYLCNPIFNNYSLDSHKGFLRLKATTTTIDQKASPTFVARKQTEVKFKVTTSLHLEGLTDGSEAGLTAYAAALNHYDIMVVNRERQNYIQAVIRIGQVRHVFAEIPVKQPEVYLSIEGTPEFYVLSYSLDNQSFHTLAKMEYRYLSTETIGGFTGVHLGLFAQSKTKCDAYADFDWFRYVTF